MVCSVDGEPLELVTTSSDSPPSTGWPPQVVVPAILWLIVNFVLIGLFSVGASLLFGLLTASWAAIDSSKLQAKGSRILGIAFKPVVVLSAVAFFLWGFGFIWYLVMRNRVKSAPVDVENASGEVVA